MSVDLFLQGTRKRFDPARCLDTMLSLTFNVLLSCMQIQQICIFRQRKQYNQSRCEGNFGAEVLGDKLAEGFEWNIRKWSFSRGCQGDRKQNNAQCAKENWRG